MCNVLEIFISLFYFHTNILTYINGSLWPIIHISFKFF
nr:MAG TPA: hypothetical protein [Caudoviricetes sp.]